MTGRAEIRNLLLAAEEEVKQAWETVDREAGNASLSPDSEAHTVLDRVAQVGVSVVESGREQAFELVVDTLIHLFRAAGEQRPPSLGIPLASDRQAMRWFDIAARVYVIGAVSVSLSAFYAIRPLVLQQPNEMRKGRFWLRDTVTALARLNRFKNNSLIGPISEYVGERAVFFRRFRNNKDELVNQLCRFDFLQCVASVAQAGDLSACYPNFGGFHKERTEPIIVDLVTGGKSRQVVGNVSDEDLATIISQLDQLADREFFSYAAWDAGYWDDARVADFLKRHARVHPT